MAKTVRTRDDIRAPVLPDRSPLDSDELLSLVCRYFCQGYGAQEIANVTSKKHGVKLGREQVYRLVRYAGKLGRVRYHAPIEEQVRESIQEAFPWLENVRVVHTASPEDVAEHAARLLLELARAHRRTSAKSEEFHVGFAGGNLLSRTAACFADMLRQPIDLPKRIVFHAMVAGFIVENPIMDPNSFFTYFRARPAINVETAFVGLPALGVVRSRDMKRLRELRTIRQALQSVKQIDVIMTSIGHSKNGDSVLSSMYAKESPRSLEQLKNAGYIGDMMWRPVNAHGPIDVETEVRAMTLMELNQLSDFIEKRKRVVLLTGPCGRCGGPKTDVLEKVLKFEPRLFTDLVVDSRTAGCLFRSEPAA